MVKRYGPSGARRKALYKIAHCNGSSGIFWLRDVHGNQVILFR